MFNWYVFQSKPRKEQLLCEQLHIRRLETFFPCIQVQPLSSYPQKTQPYFPGYVFGRVDIEASGRSAVDWIPGAIRIVNFGGEPVPVPDSFIHLLREHIKSINIDGTGSTEEFQRGDLVAIQEGPLAGYTGIFNSHLPGRDRVEVLLKMLGYSQMRIELSIKQISIQRI